MCVGGGLERTHFRFENGEHIWPGYGLSVHPQPPTGEFTAGQPGRCRRATGSAASPIESAAAGPAQPNYTLISLT